MRGARSDRAGEDTAASFVRERFFSPRIKPAG